LRHHPESPEELPEMQIRSVSGGKTWIRQFCISRLLDGDLVLVVARLMSVDKDRVGGVS